MKTQVWTLVRSGILATVLVAGTAHARKGGVGDGGGNVQAESLMGPYLIRKNLERSKLPARLALNRLEFVLNSVEKDASTSDQTLSELNNLRKKFFSGPKTIYQALEEAKFNPIDFGNCVNTTGEDRDASVNMKTSEVCFSLQSISQKLYDTSGNGKLVGLVVHEITHLAGGDEKEAVLMQNMVGSTIGSSEASSVFEFAPTARDKFNDSLTQIASGIDSAAAFANIGNTTGLCMFLPSAAMQLVELQAKVYEEIGNDGISPVRINDIWRLSAAVIKAANAMGVCYIQLGADPTDYRKPFAGKTQIPVASYYGTNWTYATPPPTGVVRDITTGDIHVLQTEIAEIADLLKTIKNNSK